MLVLGHTHLLCELCLEEVDVLGKVKCVFATLADHVGVQNVVSFLEDFDEVKLILPGTERSLQNLHQKIYHLRRENRKIYLLQSVLDAVLKNISLWAALWREVSMRKPGSYQRTWKIIHRSLAHNREICSVINTGWVIYVFDDLTGD